MLDKYFHSSYCMLCNNMSIACIKLHSTTQSGTVILGFQCDTSCDTSCGSRLWYMFVCVCGLFIAFFSLWASTGYVLPVFSWRGRILAMSPCPHLRLTESLALQIRFGCPVPRQHVHSPQPSWIWFLHRVLQPCFTLSYIRPCCWCQTVIVIVIVIVSYLIPAY